ncbi:hypothetical protein QYZ88_011550 [Lachnospiraceae bacterium C1.1]|nr:hypothetical protein [Lachnospiraceae bacterium C1.1]
MRKLYLRSIAAAVFVTAAVISNGCGNSAEVKESSEVAEDTSKVADSADQVEAEDIVESWMTPIEGTELNDGVYEIKVDSSSSMFSPEKTTLTVEAGKMTAEMHMSGSGYKYVYPGTAEEAAAATKEELIESQDDADGKNVFTFEIEALDKGIECAAFSKKKEQWYPRTLVFRSDSLDGSAFKEARGTSAESLGLEDGEYTADVTLSGGSGRASVSSPAKITVKNNEMTAAIEFSSDNYDYAIVGNETYEADTSSGKSVFTIPISAFDTEIPITADTTAMSKPHEIDYTLRFDSASLKAAE